MVDMSSYSRDRVDTSSAGSILLMIRAEMTLMFGEEVYEEFYDIFYQSTGKVPLEWLTDSIEKGETVIHMMHSFKWDELSIGERIFSDFEDIFYHLVRNSREQKVLRFKENGKIVKKDWQ